MDPATDWVNSSMPGSYGSLHFDGSNDNCVVSTPLSIPNNGDFSVSARFRPTSIPGTNRGFIGKASTNAGGNWQCFFTSGGNLAIVWVSIAATGATVLNAGQWYTVGFTRRFTGGSNREGTVYLDGQMDGQATSTDTTSSANRSLHFGASGSTSATFCPCELDDIRIYDRVLVEDDYRALRQEMLSGNPSTLNRIRRPLVFDMGGGGGGGGGGARRRRALICGAAA